MSARTISVASILADVATLDAESLAVLRRTLGIVFTNTAEPSEASAHYVAADLPCTNAKPCDKTFRTAKGVAWHLANVKHA